MLKGGAFEVGRWRGAPIRIHWSAPLGAIAFTGFSFSPMLWAGFLVLVVLHELGHAALVRHFGYRVVAVRVHAFGGDCQWRGDPTRIEVAVVAWGGVLAQAIAYAAAIVLLRVFGWPTSNVLMALAVTFTSTNAFMLLFNLLPIPPLDGYSAWPLFPMLWRARREQGDYQRARAARHRREEREAARARARRTLSVIDRGDDVEPPPLPPELKESVDRILGKKKP